MKISKKGTSIIESIVLMLIITIGVVGVLNIFSNSQKLSVNSKNRLEAISIAREGIEGITNMRDTNWILFQANLDDCWNTLNYNADCITLGNTAISSGSYILYKNTDDRWYLSGITVGGDYSSGSYRTAFEVKLDNNGFYTQSGGVTSLKPFFTREIKFDYFGTEIPPQKVKVSSIVSWSDSSSPKIQKVNLETTLTNWKKN